MRKSLLALLLVAAALPLRAQEAVHVMKPKQTLSAVSRLYGVPLKTLIRINGITNPNKIKIGTAIKLPAGTTSVSTSSGDLAIRSRTAPEAKTTTATTPADKAKEPQVLAKKTASADWRFYGPLQVDWNNWRSMAGSLVAPSLNKAGQPLYVAVNCGARKLNVTGPAGAWKTWEAPSEDFERDLVKAACLDPDLAKG